MNNSLEDSFLFTKIVQNVEYLHSTKILNDEFKPSRHNYYCLVSSMYQRLSLNIDRKTTLSCCPERLFTQRRSPSLNRFILDVFTNHVLPPVRTLSRLTNPKKDVKRYVITDTSFNGLRLCFAYHFYGLVKRSTLDRWLSDISI